MAVPIKTANKCMQSRLQVLHAHFLVMQPSSVLMIKLTLNLKLLHIGQHTGEDHLVILQWTL